MSDIIKRIQSLPPDKRALFEKQLREAGIDVSKGIGSATKDSSKEIRKVDEAEHYPMSSAQKRMYILDQLEGVGTAYNMPIMMILEGQLDISRFDDILGQLVRRHETFRTSFGTIDGEPVQRIHSNVDFHITYMESTEEKLRELAGECIRPFDLSKAPLLRGYIITLGENRHMMILDMHHIICDGMSVHTLIREFTTLYEGKNLDSLRIQYKDYSVWQKELYEGDAIKKDEEYWLGALRDGLPVLSMPLDYPRPAVQSFEGGRFALKVENNVSQKLDKLAKENGATLYMVLLAAYSTILSRYSGQEDIVVGSPVAGRPQTDLQNVIGMFVNTLAMRSYPKGEKTFEGFLNEVKDNALKAFEHQQYQFEELIDKLDIKRDMSRTPVFSAMLSMQNFDIQAMEVEGLKFIPADYMPQMSKTDLTLRGTRMEDGIQFELEYCWGLFKSESMQRFMMHFAYLLGQVADNPRIRLKDIELLTKEEKEKVIWDFNNTDAEYPRDMTVKELFEKQVEKAPDNIAAVFKGKHLTYAGLSGKGDSLARELRRMGVRPGTIVGIMAERSLEMLIGIMAVLKSGAAYLPIDPEYPAERVKHVLEDSNTGILLTHAHLRESVEFRGTILDLDAQDTNEENGTGACIEGNADDLAYVIYTSGTTGSSKGVLLENRGLVNYISWFNRKFGISHEDRTALVSSYCFDLGYTSLYSSITGGAQLHIVDKEVYQDPDELLSYIAENEITYMKLTPTLFHMITGSSRFPEAQCKKLRLIVLGGEQIKPDDVQKFHEVYPGVQIANHYGPTETTIGVISCVIDFDEFDLFRSGPFIGRPISNTKAFILDRFLNAVPVGVHGEIYICGEGLARGYLNQQKMTDERFVKNPFVPGSLMYKTGDLARRLPDGNIEFIGRADHQVKIRGYRIELTEIEGQLIRYGPVREAVADVRSGAANDKYICLYFTADREVPAPEIREHLKKVLPDYMIPSYFMQLEGIPLTPNGKVDRKALPQPQGAIDTGTRYIPPSDEFEQRLAVLWSEILGVERVGIKDNFFDIGGHSLKAAVLASRIHKEFNAEMPLREIFKAPRLEQMACYLRGTEKRIHISIPAAEEKEYYPLSSAQKRQYILGQLEGSEISYNMPRALVIDGSIDRVRFENIFRRLIERHESFRTSFHMINGEIVQKVHKTVDFHIEYKKSSPEIFKKAANEFIRPFDLSCAPLLRVCLLKLGEDKHMLLMDTHHIISDGTSTGILVKDFVSLYEEKKLDKLNIQYKDYAVWQNEYYFSDVYTRQEAYWKEAFSGEMPVLDMPLDYPRPAIQSFEGNHVCCSIDAELSKRLDNIARNSQATKHMVLLAAYTVLLSKYTGQEDIVMGSPVAGRPHADLQNIIGMFINTLAVRNYPKGDIPFREFLLQVRENSLKAYENQHYPFEELVEKLDIKRDMGRNPLFDTMFVLQNTEMGRLEVEGLEIAPYESEFNISKFDIALNAMEHENGVGFNFEYCTRLFKKETIERLAAHFLNILGQIAADEEILLKDIEIMTQQEKNKLLLDFNHTKEEYPKDKTIQELFEEQAEKTPGNEAVIYGNMSLTYKELNERANMLAWALKDKGIGPEDVVGIIAERSIEMIIGILGILKADGAYMPIDPSYPGERINYMIKDSGARLLLEQGNICGGISYGVDTLALDALQRYGGRQSNPEHTASSGSLAYIIYTSGSSGTPKANMTTHLNVMGVVKNTNYIDFYENDRILQLSNYAFDGSVFDIYGALLNGAGLVLISKDTVIDAKALSEVIEKSGITVSFMTTALFNMLVDVNIACFKNIRKVLFGGERVSVQHVKKAFRYMGPGRILHVYGPTETTVYAACHSVDHVEENPLTIPIGKPLSNTKFYVIGRNRKIQPLGVAGELCISGDGVSRGYLNRPGLTEEKFVPNPFVPGRRMYQTGDLVRWLPDGSIEFLGRIDDQVKIRGFRIEPGEVENRLLSHKDIKEAVVLAREDNGEQKYLCAYIVPSGSIASGEIREYLKKDLPEYMVPAYFVMLEKMPLTHNGKIDRKALPKPSGGIDSSDSYMAPRNATEEKLALMWQDILGTKRAGINDNFFELGGHSLKVTRLVSEIHREFNVEIPLREIFKTPTISYISSCIEGTEKNLYASIKQIEDMEYYPMSSAQKRLYILNQIQGDDISYNMPGAFMVEGQLNAEQLENAFLKLIGRHESLRTSFEMVNGSPVQIVHQQVEFKVSRSDTRINEDTVKEFVFPFNLGQAPLLRVGLVRMGENRHLMLFDMHHIISDGVSMGILIKEFAQLYRGENLPELRIRYRDYAAWQNKVFADGLLKKCEEYWLDLFSGEIPVLDMPVDYPRPVVQSFEGDTLRFDIGKELAEKLGSVALKTGTTLYMVLLAAYNVLLYKYTGQEDITVGSPIAGRSHGDLEGIIGMFVNTLAFRSRPEGSKSFEQFLDEVRDNLLKAYEYQQYPFEELVGKLGLQRDMSRNPLFDTMLTLQNITMEPLDIKGLSFSAYETGNTISKFDFSIDALETGEGISFLMYYCTRLFRRDTVQRFAVHFINILSGIADNPSKHISEIDMLPQAEKKELVYGMCRINDEYDKKMTVHKLFERHAEKMPECTAVLFQGEKFTYGRINENANRIAGYVARMGVGMEEPVAVLLDRSPGMVEAILGIWKAGCAYIPIDPKYPPQRVYGILEESGARFALTLSSYVPDETGEAYDGAWICLDTCEAGIGRERCENPDLDIDASGLSYVIYTSGSTGKPKGAMIEHSGMMNHIYAEAEELEISEKSIIAQNASHCFDVSVWQLFAGLTLGAAVAIYPDDVVMDARRFTDSIIDDGVTILEVVPSYLNVMMEYMEETGKRPEQLQYLLITGEAVKPPVVKKWFLLNPGKKAVNAYGPAEASDDVTQYTMYKAPDGETVPIGRPISNMRIYIVDRDMNLCPVGVKGEICVSGIGVGRGYLNNEEKTREVFLEDPFLTQKGVRFYKTGDVGRWLPDGNLEFYGRKDYQVKIRGYRIEPEEISSVLLEYPGIREAVVIDMEAGRGDKYLCAYITGKTALDIAQVREYLSEKLPSYMLPAYIIQIDSMPLSPNGKVDRKALPATMQDANGNREFSSPQGETEERLAALWRDILETEKVGREDDFFELGGHSLKATSLVSRIHKEFGAEVPLSQVFRSKTLKELAAFLDGAEKSIYSSIKKVQEEEYYIASSAQRRLYILWQLEGGGINYNMPAAIRIDGKLEKDRLDNTFKALIRRHETLRTSFEMIENEVFQKVHNDMAFELQYAEGGKADIDGIMKGFVRPFDLGSVPLMRVMLVRESEDTHTLLIDMHHIISDAVSENILIEEFNRLYRGEELEELKLQYKDYSHWQNNLLKSGALKSGAIRKQEEYWLKVFEDEAPVLNMPADYSRPAMQSFEGAHIVFESDSLLSGRIKALAKKEGVTIFMVLLAAYNVLLSKYTGQQDITVGTPVAGRPHNDLKNIIGIFVNTLALRNYPGERKTFREFLSEVKENALQAFENQDYQFEELVEKLDIRRDISRNPLFDTMFVLQNAGAKAFAAEGLKFSSYESDQGISKFDLILSAMELESNIYFSIGYSTRLFRKDTVERFAAHYINVLEKVAENTEMSLKDIDISSVEERRKILYDFNNTAAGYPNPVTIQELFEEQVKRAPDNIAADFEGRTITYKELNDSANRLAGVLRNKNIGPDKIVAVMVERSLEMIAGIIGILKAGGAYLPIDPEYPHDRIRYMLEDSGAGVLLVMGRVTQSLEYSGEIINLEDGFIVKDENIAKNESSAGDKSLCGEECSNPEAINSPRDLAYVIYTSGTTGKPKGAMIEHRNVVRLMFNDKMRFDFNQKDVWTMFHSYSFDFSVWEMYGALLYGGKLIIVPKATARDSSEFVQLLRRKKVTVLNQTPSSFYRVSEEEMQQNGGPLALRYVVFGGEALQPVKLREFKEKYPSVKLINMYGITETTVHVTYKEITMEEIENNISNIGVPIPTLTAYVMDKHMRPMPLGIAGELLVGGDGVGRGYLNRPELTAEKFIKNPYNENQRLYRSGDLVRWLPNGEMEYLGRIDHQVKIRGFRIELGEIETALRKYPGIKEAIVLARAQKEGQDTKRLIAYIVPHRDEVLSDTSLRGFLRESLPEYMVPSVFVMLDEIPLTANGKINARALPEPDSGRLGGEESYVAPQTETEKMLAEIWSEVLELDKVGIHDNFFDIGGDSILSIKVAAQVKKAGFELSVKDIFQHLTIHELAGHIGTIQKPSKPKESTRAFGMLSAEDSAKLFKNRDKKGE